MPKLKVPDKKIDTIHGISKYKVVVYPEEPEPGTSKYVKKVKEKVTKKRTRERKDYCPKCLIPISKFKNQHSLNQHISANPEKCQKRAAKLKVEAEEAQDMPD